MKDVRCYIDKINVHFEIREWFFKFRIDNLVPCSNKKFIYTNSQLKITIRSKCQNK